LLDAKGYLQGGEVLDARRSAMHPDTLARRLARRLDEVKDEPAAHVVVEEVWLAVVEGDLVSGERQPTVRKLAIELGVSPRTVERAYAELERLGVAATRTGEGTFVSLHPPPEEERERRREFQELCGETVARARGLGFSLEELLEALAEFRTADPEESAP
jgi:GntR family transcriptional regulator